MFEFEGQQYSLEEVQKAAQDSGLSIEEYTANAGLKSLEPVKQEGVVEDETTENPTDQSVMVSSSEDGSLDSPETDVEQFDPSSLNPEPEAFESYMGVSKKPMLVPDISDYSEIEERTKREFNSRKASSETKQTPLGNVLNYGNENVVKDFNGNIMSSVIQNDEKMQGIISNVLEENQDLLSQSLNDILEPLGGIENITEEDLKKAKEKYDDVVKKTIFKDPLFTSRYDQYQDALTKNHEKDNNTYITDKQITKGSSMQNFALRSAYKAFPEMYKSVYKGIYGIGTDIKSGGLGANAYLQVQRMHQSNVSRAEKEGWTDDTVGYYNNKGAFMVAVKGQAESSPVSSGYTKKGTWSEAKVKSQDIIKDGRENQEIDIESIFERQAIASAFGQQDIRDVFTLGKSWETMRNIAGEQIPQMASAILTYGMLPGAQMMGSNYLIQVQKIARERYNTLEPTIDQLMRVVEDDTEDKIFESASLVGAASGVAEYVGATSVLKKSIGLAAIRGLSKNSASLVKGQFKLFLKQSAKRGSVSVRGGFDEAMTELFQQVASDVTVDEYNKENYIQGGGTGALMGFMMPFGAGVVRSTNREIANTYSIATGKLDLKGMREFQSFNIKKLNKDLENKVITREEYDEKVSLLEDFSMASTRVDRSMSEDHKTDLMEALVQESQDQKNLQKFQESEPGKKAKGLEKRRQEEIKEIDNKVKSKELTEKQGLEEKIKIGKAFLYNVDFRSEFILKNNLSKSIRNTAAITDFYNNLTSTIDAFGSFKDEISIVENTREYAKLYLETKGLNASDENIEAMALELKNNPGVFMGNDGKIIVNAEGSIATKNVTTASHEVLHRVLYKALTALNKKGNLVQNEEAVKNISNALIKHLSVLEQKGRIRGLDALRTRLHTYSTFYIGDEKYSYKDLIRSYGEIENIDFSIFTDIKIENFRGKNRVNTGEEVLTLLSDAIITNKLQYDATLFEQLNDIIRRLLQKAGLKDIKFDSGKDVFNFVRDFNKSIEKGRSTKAQRKFAEYGGAGVLMEIDENSIGSRAVADMFSKKEPTDVQRQMSEQVQKLWDEEGPLSVYKISDMYRPMFRKISIRGNWDQLPGWEDMRDIIEDEAVSSVKGLMGIVLSYKPEKGVPLAAYINKYFALRAAAIKNEYLGETFNTNIDDLKGGGPAVYEEEAIEKAIDEKAAPLNEFSRLRRKLELDPLAMNKIRAVVIRALSLSPDLLSTRKWKPSLFRSFVFEIYKSQIYGTMLNKFPTNSKEFRMWATRNKGWIQNELSLNTLRKFPALRGVLWDFKVDENGKQLRYTTEESIKLGIKDVYSGVSKIQRLKPTEDQWQNYLDPTRIGRSRNMPHEHKRVLAEAMSIDLGLDATLEVMQNPNQQEFKLDGTPVDGRVIDMYERMVENNADVVEENQVIGRVAYLIERDPLVKFSQSALDAGMGGLRMAELIMDNPQPLIDAFKTTISPYKLMTDAKRDRSLGELRKALSKAIVDTFKKNYPWLNELSAEVLSKQLALDFAKISRAIDAQRKSVQDSKEQDFKQALSDNLFKIAENTVLNEGYEAVITEANVVSQEVKAETLAKVFKGESAKDAFDYLFGDRKSPLNDTGSPMAYFQAEIAEVFMRSKILYQNGNLNRDEVFSIFEMLFESQGKNKNPLINFAAPVGMSMVVSEKVPTQFIYSIPPKYLSGYLANVVTNPRKTANDMLVLGDFVQVRVTKAYAKKLVNAQGIGMPHFRDNIEPSSLSRISRVPVGKTGSNIIEFYRSNKLAGIMQEMKDGSDIAFNPVSSQVSQSIEQENIQNSQSVRTINHQALVKLDYNNTLYENLDNLFDSLSKFSKSDNTKSFSQFDLDAKALLDELQNSGTLSSDPIAQANLEEKERLNELAAALDSDFNDILENVTSIPSKEEISEISSKQIGKRKNNNVLFVPPSHDDYRGLIENYLVGSGQDAKSHRSFFEEYLLEPYYEGINNYSSERVRMVRQYRNIKDAFAPLFKTLKNEAFPGFNVESAIRVYIWNRQGYEIEGVNDSEIKKCIAFVVKNGLAREAAMEVMKITHLHGHIKPGKNWNSGGLIGDIIDSLKTNSRNKYLEEWNRNVDFIFNDKNMNKMRAAFGVEYADSLKNILGRMKTGRNRVEGDNTKFTNGVMNWLNGSVGVVMFANTRSAMLQLISTSNYVEASGPNNILNAAATFVNQKQFWSDAFNLMRSDYMVERREGLQIDINEAELVDATQSSSNKIRSAITWLLSKGFMPTQIADSLAIIVGGASYYRNYVKQYMSQGLSKEEAETRAFIDFRNKTEESQQSSKPDRISAQQASTGGRVLLTFSNTQAQYARIIKKEMYNIKNGRGNAAVSLARISYYSMAQNALFISLQSALLGSILGFSDNDDEEEGVDSNTFKLINGILNSLLRGAGIRGHILSVIKDTGITYLDQAGKPNPKFGKMVKTAFNISPSLGAKFTRAKSVEWYLQKAQEDYGTLDMLTNTNNFKAIAVAASVAANIPADRLLQKYENLMNVLDLEHELEAHEQLIIFLGWPDYQIGVEKPEENKKRTKSGTSKKRTKSRSGKKRTK